MPRESTANGDGNFHKAKLNRNPRAAAVDYVDVVVDLAVDVASTLDGRKRDRQATERAKEFSGLSWQS